MAFLIRVTILGYWPIDPIYEAASHHRLAETLVKYCREATTGRFRRGSHCRRGRVERNVPKTLRNPSGSSAIIK